MRNPTREELDRILFLILVGIMAALAFSAVGCGPVTSSPVDHFYVSVSNQTRDPVTIIVLEGATATSIGSVSSQTIPAGETGVYEFGTVPAQVLELSEPAGALLFPFATFTFAGGPCPYWVWHVDYPSGQGFGSVPVVAPSRASSSQ